MAADWRKIKTEWLKGGKTYAELARKYGIAEKTIRNRAYKEGWKNLKGQVKDKVEAELCARVARARVSELEKLIEANDRMIDVTLSLVTQIAEAEEHNYMLTDANGSLKNVTELSKSIQILVANQRDLLKLPTLDQDMAKKNEAQRKREAKAKLELEREKWETEKAEKAKAQSVRQGTVWKIEAPEGEPIDE